VVGASALLKRYYVAFNSEKKLRRRPETVETSAELSAEGNCEVVAGKARSLTGGKSSLSISVQQWIAPGISIDIPRQAGFRRDWTI